MCLFINTRRASLTIVKNTVGGDGAFGFTSQALGELRPDDRRQYGATQISRTWQPGTYAVAETVPTGWDLTGAVLLRWQQPGQHQPGAGRERHLHLHRYPERAA